MIYCLPILEKKKYALILQRLGNDILFLAGIPMCCMCMYLVYKKKLWYDYAKAPARRVFVISELYTC